MSPSGSRPAPPGASRPPTCRCFCTWRWCLPPACGCRSRSSPGSAPSRSCWGEAMTSRIAALLASFTPLEVLRPWPRYAVDEATWDAIGAALGAGEGELMALWAEPAQVHLSLRAPDLTEPAIVSLAATNNTFPSIGRRHAPALRPERAIRDLYGLDPVGIPDARPWLGHGA